MTKVMCYKVGFLERIRNEKKLPLKQYLETISKKFENNTKKIMAIEYHYDLINMFTETNNLSSEEKYSLYEMLINDYLNKIKSLKYHPKLNEIAGDINDITEFYNYTYKVNNKLQESTLYEIDQEADDIVDDLYLKLFNSNGRKLQLPIKIENIINLQIRSFISKDDLDKVFYWIILKLSVMYSYLSSKN